jgi:hypothetical protein
MWSDLGLAVGQLIALRDTSIANGCVAPAQPVSRVFFISGASCGERRADGLG